MHKPILLSPVDTRYRVLLFCLLLASYLLIYLPQPDSADGDAVLAVAAATLREGSPNINAVAYADWLLPMPASRMGAFGVDGALYAKKGPTPSLALLPLVALAEALPWLSTRAAAMLLNPLVTATTALLLYTLVRRLGYRPAVALATGLVYGLTTMALVYSKTLFGEPLAALLLLVAFMGLTAYHTSGRARPLLAAGIALGLLIGVNTVYAVFVPLGMALAFVPAARHPTRRALLAAGLPVVTAFALLALFNWARFGSPFDSGYHFAEGEGFTQPLLTGLYGLFLSPFRGLFWYNPVLLLALPGWLMLRRHAPSVAWSALLLAAAQALLFASWWSWHGGITWGPRFLLPVLPLFVLALVPLLDTAFSRRRGRGGIVLVLLAFVLLSLGVQLLGALYDYGTYNNGYLNARFWTGDFSSVVPGLPDFVLTTPELSPIIGNMALLSAGWPVQPVWVQAGDLAHLLAALAVAAVGLLVMIPWWQPLEAMILASIVTVVCLNVIVAQQGIHPDIAAMRTLNSQLSPGDTVVATTTLYESALLDLKRKRVVTLNAPTTADDPWARALWNYARAKASDLWLVTWFGPADPLNWPERELMQIGGFVSERPVEGHRAVLFDLNTVPADRDLAVTFGPVALEQMGARLGTRRVAVTLVWSAASRPDANYNWFVHLLDADGNIIAQQDRAPQGGYLPTSAWTSGQTVIDHLTLFLSDGVTGGPYRLRIGWVNSATSEPLPVTIDGLPRNEPYVVLPLDG